MLEPVFIIILNWNGLNDTIECVESCLKLDYPSFTIVIVDNGSDDDSELTLRRIFPEAIVLQTGANIGYAGGNNFGIRYALEADARYVWLLNNDTVVDPMALTELVNAAGICPENGMIGSKILFFSDTTLIHYAGGLVNANLGTSRHLGFGLKDDHQFDHMADTGYITGCSLLVKPSVIEAIGLMDEGYFLYFEESDWCIKAKKNGFRLIYAPKSVIYHKESVSTKKIAGALTYYMTRNRLYFISRNGTKVKWLRRFGSDLLGLLKYVHHRDFTQARSMLAAYRHWISGYRGRREDLSKPQKS